MNILNINPDTLYDGSPNGMSQARVDTDTGLVFVSGQVDWNTEFAVSSSDIGVQTERAMQHLHTVLEEAGSSFENVLQLRIFVRGEVSEHLEKIVPVMVRHFGTVRPALTGIGVASLVSPELLVEIEAIAKVSE